MINYNNNYYIIILLFIIELIHYPGAPELNENEMIMHTIEIQNLLTPIFCEMKLN